MKEDLCDHVWQFHFAKVVFSSFNSTELLNLKCG